MWKCSVCGRTLTYIENDEVKHETHFDIQRSRKHLLDDDGSVEEDFQLSSIKMQRQLCEKCFLKILNESKTLSKLFYEPHLNKLVY